MTRIAVMMTCHNRRTQSLACLDALRRQATHADLDVYLLDDASTDGTADAVRAEHPEVRVYSGDGNFYWCGGMRQLWSLAAWQDYDHYLWLNDDTLLDEQALNALLSTASQAHDGIVVGTLRDPQTQQPTYGGVARASRWHPFRYRLVVAQDQPLPCDTMNGNCVLVSREAARRVGNFDGSFRHSFGDFDYGLRARKLGVEMLVTAGTIGCCPRRTSRQRWRDATLGWRQRWAEVTGPKGLPPRQMLVYARRHGGPMWWAFWCMPYLRALLMPTRRRTVRWRFLPTTGASQQA